MNDGSSVIEVLTVDDEIDICILLDSLLQQHHISSQYATSIQDAKAALVKKEPDILLLDNHLSDGKGLDFIPYIKLNYPLIHIIMISAYDGKEEYKKANQLGAIAFISKPFNRETVLNTIDNVIESLDNSQNASVI